MKLLSDQASNAKLSKNAGVNAAYRTSILYLAPADTAIRGKSVCTASTPGCRKACLFTAGRGAMNSVQKARVRKTLLYFKQPKLFAALLVADLERLVKRQKRTGVRQVVRLNGTSDIDWENFLVRRSDRCGLKGVPQAFPELQFYDYTKRPERALKHATSINWPSNYHLTMSQSEVNGAIVKRLQGLSPELNAAIVFTELPTTWKGRRVIDGTKHDMRFLDPKGVVVGLLPKGAAKKDKSGFVVSP